ncbi:hypothetical protein MMC07_001913 [Pseudocyphellaria aurata]|nr:hypothetical protein [Pseudocyphellaria aurata]
MTFFSKVFRTKDREGGVSKSKKHLQENGAIPTPPPKQRWEDAWARKDVEPEEVQELLRGCTHELKSRALDMPFLLLPFRPASDPSAARSFIRNYFNPDRGPQLQGDRLSQELLLTEPMVLCSVMKWCWSRLAGGVVTWEAYELFRVGEQDSDLARDAFATFIPISVESDARTKIIFDYFDLMAAIAAHGKTNGMGGRKLSRLAGWWAFEQVDLGNGFDGGYKSWSSAADAASHLFFAYLRSLSPDSVKGINGISALPLSLQALVQATEYPPEQLNMSPTSKVVMIVDSVSPTPFALLRRAKHFQYRDEDRALQEFSNYDDPVQALTEECRRVLKSISSTNQSTISTSKTSTSLRDASWSRFEDIGFGGFGDYSDQEDEVEESALAKKRRAPPGLRSTPQSKNHDRGRPTTPSWADFLSSGFVDETKSNDPAPLLLPHDKILPPIDTRRGKSSQSHRRATEDFANLEPGELASINNIYYDDSFWWVWISSLAGEETTERKSVFGRCALIETTMRGGKWLIMEEIVKGAAPEPEQGAYIAEKKSRFGFTKRGKLTRTKSASRKPPPMTQPYGRNAHPTPTSKTSIGPDQHARIQAAAAALQQKQRQNEQLSSPRRARMEDAASTKTNSVFTLQPVIMSEAAPAMKWANTYDKNAIRAAYLGSNFAGKGSTADLSGIGGPYNFPDTNGSVTPMAPNVSIQRPVANMNSSGGRLPRDDSGLSGKDSSMDRDLPALPPDTPAHHNSAIPIAERKPVPPAPLPIVPSQNRQVSNDAATQAAQVPLPSVSPENPRPSNAKPLPRVRQSFDGRHNMQNGPAGSLQEANNGPASPASSPESQKVNKLTKSQGGGIKGMFGKRKPEPSIRHPPPQPVARQAVAAARAAYVGPQMKPNYPGPNRNGSQTNLGRRLSLIGRKKSPALTGAPSSAVAPIQDSEEREVEAPAQISPNRFGSHDNVGSQTSLNRVKTYEDHPANREFRSFDQGPMMDQPAFVPEDSPERQVSEPPTPVEHMRDEIPPGPQQVPLEPHQVSPGSQQILPGTQQVPEIQLHQHEVDLHRQPGERLFIRESQHVESELSESEDDRSASPALDRWAQIRKNAAERAAKQQQQQPHEDPPRRSNDGDADGETSGEETIESRVARIKARVAELTGNMDGPGAHREQRV